MRQKVTEDLDDLIPENTTAAATNKTQFTLSAAQQLNTVASKLTPSSFGQHLVDHLAHYLLGKKQNKEVEFALKLALRRIVYMVGGPAFHVQEHYFKERHLEAFLEESGNSKPSLESGLDAGMIEVYTEFLGKVDDSTKEARIFLMQKRMKALSGGGEDSVLMKMLDILDYMIADGLPLPDSKVSKLSWYRKTAHILDTLFRKSGVSLNDGEWSCNATKLARNESRLLCDDKDDKKPAMIGRKKIDLLLNASPIDISSSEQKKDGACASLVLVPVWWSSSR